MTGSVVTIIDYGMGNIRSVQNALESLGASVRVSRDRADLQSADRLVLPGVGAFGDGMRKLRDASVIDTLREEVLQHGKPLIGLCLGMQLFADVGLEHGAEEGLGWVPGQVLRLQSTNGGIPIRVPHMGWNSVERTSESILLQGIADPLFYFVHSFHFMPTDPKVVRATCSYGSEFAAVIERGNLFGTQFHPEKSQYNGLRVLRNFLEMA